MLGKYWLHLMIATIIISLISIKAFPLALELSIYPYYLKFSASIKPLKGFNR